MGASAGRYGVAIGTGAASGAGMGASFGPVGAVIGGGVGALGGALSTLLQSSDEAKQRKKAMEQYERQRWEALEAYKRQQQQKYYDEWEQRYAARNGLSNDPMYQATHHGSYDEGQVEADFNARAGDAPTFADEPTPNYGALVQSLGSLGSTVGGLSRQANTQSRLDDLTGGRNIAATGNPWANYADAPEDPMQQLVERARQAAWSRTGGW